MNDKVAARHLCRRATVYVRQSSVHQVTAIASDVEIIDEDLGRSATSTFTRMERHKTRSEAASSL